MIGQVLKRSKNSLKMSSIVSMWADFCRGVLKNRQVFSKIYIVKNIVFTSFNHFLDCPLTRMVEGFPQSKRPSFRKAPEIRDQGFEDSGALGTRIKWRFDASPRGFTQTITQREAADINVIASLSHSDTAISHLL